MGRIYHTQSKAERDRIKQCRSDLAVIALALGIDAMFAGTDGHDLLNQADRAVVDGRLAHIVGERGEDEVFAWCIVSLKQALEALKGGA
jgi:hypothetical protein